MQQSAKPPETKKFNIFNFIEQKYLILFTLLLLFNIYLTFFNLGSFAVETFDEAAYGINAFEAISNDEYLVNTLFGDTDLYNLKPVLSFWGIALSFKIFGVSAFSLRLVSALSFVFLSVALFFITKKLIGRLEALFVFALISTNFFFFEYHFARSGDVDALFSLFQIFSIGSLLFAKKAITQQKRYLFLYLYGFGFALSFLTKSFHAMPVIATGFLFWIINIKKIPMNLKTWSIFLTCAFLPIAVWATGRYLSDGTVFFEAMFGTDIVARASAELGTLEPFYFYLEILFFSSPLAAFFSTVSLVSTIYTVYSSIKQKNETLKDFYTVCFLWLVVPIVMYSVSPTKFVWYILPSFIPLYLMFGVSITQVVRKFKLKHLASPLSVFALLSYCVFGGYSSVVHINNPTENLAQTFMVEQLSQNPKLKGKNAYIETVNDIWVLSTGFVAEGICGFNIMPGGINGFISDIDKQNAVLIVNKKPLGEAGGLINDYEVIAHGNDYYALVAG